MLASGPILKLLRERSVWAPQYLSAGTFTSPIVSCSIRYSILNFLIADPKLANQVDLQVGLQRIFTKRVKFLRCLRGIYRFTNSGRVKMVSNRVNMVSGRVNMVLGRVNMVLGRVNIVSDGVNMVLYRVNMVLDRVNMVLYRVNMVSDGVNMVLGRVNMVSGRYQGLLCPKDSFGGGCLRGGATSTPQHI